MKSFALVAPGNFGWADIPVDPPPGPGEVTVHPVACGICASDLHYWLHGRIHDQVIRSYPFTLGHECAGTITAIGPGVTDLKSGQRVAVEPAVACGHCPPCLAGRENICPNVRFLATPPYHGALRETILIPARNVEPIPDSISFEAAALAEPLGVGIHATRLAAVAPGETIAIFGAGAIGFSVAFAARARDAARIIFAEPVPERRTLAIQLGFEAIPLSPDPVTVLRDLTGGGPDIAFEAAGDPQAMNAAVQAPRLGGKAAIIGIPVEDAVSLDIHRMRRSELTLFNCRRSNRTLHDAITLLTHTAKDMQRIATHRFPVHDAEHAFDLAARRAEGLVKAMLMLT